MSEELIVRHGSPTLPGLKTGSLFSCACPDGAELCRTLRSWNRRLAPKGVRALGLRLLKGRALIYVYRPARLARDLERAEVRALLADRDEGQAQELEQEFEKAAQHYPYPVELEGERRLMEEARRRAEETAR